MIGMLVKMMEGKHYLREEQLRILSNMTFKEIKALFGLSEYTDLEASGALMLTFSSAYILFMTESPQAFASGIGGVLGGLTENIGEVIPGRR